jgi:hypothetical protein
VKEFQWRLELELSPEALVALQELSERSGRSEKTGLHGPLIGVPGGGRTQAGVLRYPAQNHRTPDPRPFLASLLRWVLRYLGWSRLSEEV